MRTRKFLRVMGILELILGAAFLIISFVSLKRNPDTITIFNNGGFNKIILLITLFTFPAIRIIGGLWGIVARGKKPMMVLGILMIVNRIPNLVNCIRAAQQTTAIRLWLVLDIVCIVISAMYFVGALLYRKPPKPVKPGKGPEKVPPMPPAPEEK